MLIGGHYLPDLKAILFRTSSISLATSTPKGPWLLFFPVIPLVPFLGVYPLLTSPINLCDSLLILNPPPTTLPLLLRLENADGDVAIVFKSFLLFSCSVVEVPTLTSEFLLALKLSLPDLQV